MSSFDDMPDDRRAVAPIARGSDATAEDIRRRARQSLQTEGFEAGVRTLIELAGDKKQKGSTRGAAAKALVQSGATVQLLSQEDLAEMPAEQIRVLLAEAERALANRLAVLKTIEHEPTAPGSPRPIVKLPPRANLFD
jgi:HEAT repeat protein